MQHIDRPHHCTRVAGALALGMLEHGREIVAMTSACKVDELSPKPTQYAARRLAWRYSVA